MKTTVKDGQSLIDIALITTGSVEGVWSLALRNGLGLTEDVVYGQTIDWEVREAAVEHLFATAVSDGAIDKLLRVDIPEVKPPYELIVSDKPKRQPTRAQIFTGEFTAAFA